MLLLRASSINSTLVWLTVIKKEKLRNYDFFFFFTDLPLLPHWTGPTVSVRKQPLTLKAQRFQFLFNETPAAAGDDCG